MQRSLLLLLTILAGSLSAEDFSRPEIHAIGDQRILFVDDSLIASQQQTALQPHLPVPREVVLVCDAPWEGNISGYYTFFKDEDRFRVYYRGAHFDEKTQKPAHREVTCYAESTDGIHWEKPNLGLVEFQGSKANNIVWSSALDGFGSHNFTPFKDSNPDCTPEARYKALAGDEKGLRAYQSADGLRWSPMQEKRVITNGAFDSQNLAFWDTNRKCYVDFHRHFRNGKIRDIMTCTSNDFLHWTEPTYLVYEGAPSEQLYTNAIALYFRAPQLYVGFPTRYQPKTQQVEPVLMTSHDGLHFHRWPEPLVPMTAPQDRDGNRSNYMASGILQVPGQDREISVYATEAYYKGPASRVRRFTFRTDGFVSVSAVQRGEILTHPLQFTGNRLTVNSDVQAGGSLRIEIQDLQGHPLPGFTLAESVAVTGDEIEQTVSWSQGQNVSSLSNQPVRLRFVLKQADLYAFKFQQ